MTANLRRDRRRRQPAPVPRSNFEKFRRADRLVGGCWLRWMLQVRLLPAPHGLACLTTDGFCSPSTIQRYFYGPNGGPLAV
jgi:hypothetical protein